MPNSMPLAMPTPASSGKSSSKSPIRIWRKAFAAFFKREAFVSWFRDPGERSPVTAEVFGAAPPALTGVVSLHQTVEMVRLSIEVVEENIVAAVGEEDAAAVREAVVRYAREVAFATAEVYARAAEMRGAWDARLEALVVDSVLRAEADETTRSRASALGWESRGDVVVVLGRVPAADSGSRDSLFDDVRRSARHAEGGARATGRWLRGRRWWTASRPRPSGTPAQRSEANSAAVCDRPGNQTANAHQHFVL